ncbi:MAG: helix-turn-helix domain-containing protein [Pseudonocardiaceae bacterium]
MTRPTPQGLQLAARLKALRVTKFRSGNQFAHHVGWPQPRVSKLETGAQRPSVEDIRIWVSAVGAGREVEAELLAMLAATRFMYVTHRETAHEGIAARQASFMALEEQASRIMEFQPALVPGIVQTATYARELMALHGGPLSSGYGAADVEELISWRIKRQQVLYQAGKRVCLVVGETALCDPPGAIETLIGQLDRLAAIAGLPTVSVGVLRMGTAMPCMPLGSFVVHDESRAFVETMTGEQRLDDPVQVAVYGEAFDRLHAASLTGADAVSLIQRVAVALRSS